MHLIFFGKLLLCFEVTSKKAPFFAKNIRNRLQS